MLARDASSSVFLSFIPCLLLLDVRKERIYKRIKRVDEIADVHLHETHF